MHSSQAVAALSALAHEHRLGVYRMLVVAGPQGLNAGTIATRLKVPPSSLTFHLQNLHRAGLVTQQRRSRELIYAADFDAMNGLVDFLTENCCGGAEACRTECAPTSDTKANDVKKSRKSSRAA
jgi:DNA-binding transcriptional ArsR family regulator